MKFIKYHGLGNDYLVVNPADLTQKLTEECIAAVCERHTGVGSDGILLGPFLPGSDDFAQICHAAGIAESDARAGLGALRIYNPDGSEAEKSGNGLRIFSRYLYDIGMVKKEAFYLNTLGGRVKSKVIEPREQIQVEMGRVSFLSSDIPMLGEAREVIREKIVLKGREFVFCAANIGNPHCIVLCEEISAELAKEFGPLLENHPMFPEKANVQFMRVLGPQQIAIEVWERGAGYTLASGSSACANAATAQKLGLCRSPITVTMPGGEILTQIDNQFNLIQSGPVRRVCEGEWQPEQE
ncbi:MAG: diaminopimelate epimerase [Oligosphaeraceae bacterium]|nr:diaminopimelate epimerase [Oligosphaeraceae bacterium]